MPSVEFVAPGQPVSVQARRQARKRKWEELIRSQARASLPNDFSLYSGTVLLVICYFHTDVALDVDNIVKRLQDAIVGIVLIDDSLVSDLIVRKRDLGRPFVVERVSPVLAAGLERQRDFVYVSVSEAKPEDLPV
jgi:crossover junction endodeoxyribonuclease RusA